jgi:hypothetical protein
MSLLTLLVVIICAGVLVYCINRWVPMSPPFKSILVIVAVIVIGLLVLNAFGVIDALSGVRVPRVR